MAHIDIDASNKRGKERLKRDPIAIRAQYLSAKRSLRIDLSNGIVLEIPARLIEGLAGRDGKDIKDIRIMAPGYGLHFEGLDVDLYIPGLVAGVFGSEKWMARINKDIASKLGRIGGSVKSDAKATAARRNGALGGRPRKSSAG